MNRRLNIHAMQVHIIRGRGYQDWCDALAYSLYLIHQGRIGSRAEREYIDAERANRQYRRLASSIKEFKFDEAGDEDDLETGSDGTKTPCHSDGNVTPFTSAINDDDGGKESLLNGSFRSSTSSRRSSVVS